MLKVMNIKVMVTMEANEIMFVSLMVTHENILAMNTSIIFPPTLGFLYGLSLGVIITRERYIVTSQIVENLFLSFHIPYPNNKDKAKVQINPELTTVYGGFFRFTNELVHFLSHNWMCSCTSTANKELTITTSSQGICKELVSPVHANNAGKG